MLESVVFALIGVVSVVSIVFVALAIHTRDLLKATVYSAVQSTLYALILFLLMAPDIVLVYIAVSVGLLPLITITILKKVGRYE